MIKTEPIMARTTAEGRFIVDETTARSNGVTVAAVVRRPIEGRPDTETEPFLRAEIDPFMADDGEPNILLTDATGLELVIPAAVFRRWASTALKIFEG